MAIYERTWTHAVRQGTRGLGAGCGSVMVLSSEKEGPSGCRPQQLVGRTWLCLPLELQPSGLVKNDKLIELYDVRALARLLVERRVVDESGCQLPLGPAPEIEPSGFWRCALALNGTPSC